MKFYSPKAQEICSKGLRILFKDGYYETEDLREIEVLVNLPDFVAPIYDSPPINPDYQDSSSGSESLNDLVIEDDLPEYPDDYPNL